MSTISGITPPPTPPTPLSPPAEDPFRYGWREVRVTRLLEESHHEGRVFHTLSPYVGCLIGCRYCYAQSHVVLARRLARRIEAPWGSYVDVRVNAADVLAAELARGDVRIVKFCPIVSDPYQGVERRYGLTRACLETIAHANRRPAVRA